EPWFNSGDRTSDLGRYLRVDTGAQVIGCKALEPDVNCGSGQWVLHLLSSSGHGSSDGTL
ncbi:hypothetical protein P7K49_028127, partial [Saguinus oedipus]